MASHDAHLLIKRRLAAVLAQPDGPHAAEYTDALITAEQTVGPEMLSDTELLLASAMACDTCIQSGGLVSCFEYAAQHLLRADGAMTLIGLPAHADLLSCVQVLHRDGFQDRLVQLAPIEDAYLDLGLSTVTDAVLAYIQQNHVSLRRPSL